MTAEVTGEVFSPDVLPYGVVTVGSGQPRVAVPLGDTVLDLTAAAAARWTSHARLFEGGTLDGLLGAGRPVWQEVRRRLQGWVVGGRFAEEVHEHLIPLSEASPRLPFTVADYVDFYSCEHHATNVGRIFRPDGDPLTPNWKHLPIGYHGRSGTVVVSGTPVPRPHGQYRSADGSVVFGPSRRLDIEVELGFVVGTASERGRPVGLEDFERHVFGVVLVNDWSARDIQAWEYVPLGPFLGKSFATSVSPWVVPLDALEGARIAPPARDPRPLPYLDDAGAAPWGLDLGFEVRINGDLVSCPPFGQMYWTPAQQLAHLTVNGACVRTGDLFASGTVSGAERHERGSLLELTWNGRDPLQLRDGTSRSFLEDGDTVRITASAPARGGGTVWLGAVEGTVTPGGR